MADQHVWLQIEPLENYNPVPKGTDCLRGDGHENGKISLTEIAARKLRAVVYREYLDTPIKYTVIKPDKLILADSTEPNITERIGTVIYTKPGTRLYVHVHNIDDMPHSFHVHGLSYGIESDGSWPFGTKNSLGQRSDQLCTDELWTYTFDITADMLGAWPFHDHYRDIMESVNMGLFGGIIVVPDLVAPWVPPSTIIPGPIQDLTDSSTSAQALIAVNSYLPEFLETQEIEIAPTDVVHAPIFIHTLGDSHSSGSFNTGSIQPAPPNNSSTINLGFTSTSENSDLNYHCSIHPGMNGKIEVRAGATSINQVVHIIDDGTRRFNPENFQIKGGPSSTVTWINDDSIPHTATQGNIPSFCFNGRSFVGNSPIIEVVENQPIRFYVFNLDLGENWHNFHTHGMRWKQPLFKYNEMISSYDYIARQDTRTIGPAESFIVDTNAPKIMFFSAIIEAQQADPPPDATLHNIKGDFLFHCHVEHHMMEGLVGLVRVRRSIWLTNQQYNEIQSTTGLPIAPSDARVSCPEGDENRCQNLHMGIWEYIIGDSPATSLPGATMMHQVLIPNTNKVLYWGYVSTHSPSQDTYIFDLDKIGTSDVYKRTANQPFDTSIVPHGTPNARDFANIWSAAQTILTDEVGTILVFGGFTCSNISDMSHPYWGRITYLFHPDLIDTNPWECLAGSDFSSLTNITDDGRYYSACLILPDGRPITLIGSFRMTGISNFASNSYEIYDASSPSHVWNNLTDLNSLPFSRSNYLYYPWTYLLPDGQLLVAGPKALTFKFDPFNISDVTMYRGAKIRDHDDYAQEGTSCLLPLRVGSDYAAQILVAGGETADAWKSSQLLNLADSSPQWRDLPDLHYIRKEAIAVILADGNILLCGGAYSDTSGMPIPGAAEIFDTESYTWSVGAANLRERVYHNSAILMPDGSVVFGGDVTDQRDGDITKSERYKPPYFHLARPKIADSWSPGVITYGGTFNLEMETDANEIRQVALIRPGAVTHGYNMNQRFVECEFTIIDPVNITVTVPPNSNITPPGWHMVVAISGGVCFNDSCDKVPSIAKWIYIKP